MKRPRPNDKSKKEENLLSFLGGGAPPQPKKKKPPAPLTVPLNINVPAVVRLEKAGYGISTNTLTGEVKHVTKGKNATKGRATVASDRVAVVMPFEEDHDDDDDDASVSAPLPPPQLEPDLGYDDDDEDDHDASDDNGFAAKRKREEAQIAEEMATRRAPPPATYHKPDYVDDAWSMTTIRELRRKLLLKQHNGHRPLTTKSVPAFYHRRERDPVTTTIKSKTDADLETHCKLLTFNADGSFAWPLSSPHACWNCCYNFDGPPAMVPRFYNRYHNVYEVYGNFCSWPCAKRFAQTTNNEYYYEHAPSLDAFVNKYFGIEGTISVAPPRYVLEKFSSFGMTIDQYRALGEHCVVDVHFVEPPCVPYEVFVMWQTRGTANKKINTGYALDKKSRFESQMRGAMPLPQMPPAIESVSVAPLSKGGNKSATKKQKKNLLSLFT